MGGRGGWDGNAVEGAVVTDPGKQNLIGLCQVSGHSLGMFNQSLVRVDFVVLLFFIEARFLCADSHSNAYNSSESQGRNSELHPGV